jgi:hypothetical protein
MPSLTVVGGAGDDHQVACHFPTLYGSSGSASPGA